MALATPRNGVASAQVVVSSDRWMSNITAPVGEMGSAQGVVVDPKRLLVRYATTQSAFPALQDTPLAATTMQPIWVTARLDKSAPAGVYRGTLAAVPILRDVPKSNRRSHPHGSADPRRYTPRIYDLLAQVRPEPR